MVEKDALFAFMDSLTNWAKLELQRRGVQDLAQAMVVVESLIEFKKGTPKDKEQNNNGRDKEKPLKEGEDNSPKENFKKGEKGESFFKPKTSCFLCEGPH